MMISVEVPAVPVHASQAVGAPSGSSTAEKVVQNLDLRIELPIRKLLHVRALVVLVRIVDILK